MKYLRNMINFLVKPKKYRLAPIKKQGPTGFDLEYDLSLVIRKNQPLCVDVGANKGQTIDDFLSWLNEPQIISFEPSSELFDLLEKTKQKKARKWQDVSLFQYALGEESKTISFTNYENSFLNSILSLQDKEENPFRGDREKIVSTEDVEMMSLDTFIETNDVSHIDLLKIDTQGYDLQVIKGARKALANKKIDFVFLEMNFVDMYQGQGSATEIIEYLSQFGLKVIGFYDVYRSHNSNTIAWCSTLFGRA